MQENERIGKEELANFKRLIIRGSLDHAQVGPHKKEKGFKKLKPFSFFSSPPTHFPFSFLSVLNTSLII
jgi:hypothetical protein